MFFWLSVSSIPAPFLAFSFELQVNNAAADDMFSDQFTSLIPASSPGCGLLSQTLRIRTAFVHHSSV